MVVAGKRLLCCAITDLGIADDTGPNRNTQRLDPAAARRTQLHEQVRSWAVDGVDIVQLREKRLESGELFALTVSAVAAIEAVAAVGTASDGGRRTRLVVNGRADVAAAAGADGVHLTSATGELTPAQVRQVFAASGRWDCLVSVSCHTVEEVAAFRDGDADLILFGPVFEKQVAGRQIQEGSGLEQLRLACRTAGAVPVLALGGIMEASIADCLEAGAAGVAGIRLFGPAMRRG